MKNIQLLQIDIFQLPFVQANIKFNDFSRLNLNCMTFPGLYEPWDSLTDENGQ